MQYVILLHRDCIDEEKPQLQGLELFSFLCLICKAIKSNSQRLRQQRRTNRPLLAMVKNRTHESKKTKLTNFVQ
ncbi:uncharacterized protein N0V89_002269 [Didymosphaeria variabile]|uniref:Uncharacterized protein n=1 Tax=Didymosphaeria variabile TaxID=1932322 RepID=A0A9W8XTT5_9PLEO|nr:uncharacterized protein N0V89_002269 [Didymosphaeria variabile]KAJ4357693.1 hypothetical protein N0V89_002269 [Didymosphaeria variabile]